jgi:hypothetical protein
MSRSPLAWVKVATKSTASPAATANPNQSSSSVRPGRVLISRSAIAAPVEKSWARRGESLSSQASTALSRPLAPLGMVGLAAERPKRLL